MSDFLYDLDSDMLNENISAWELETSLKSFHSGKAPGPDGIVVEMFKMQIIYYVLYYLNYLTFYSISTTVV